MSLVETQNNGEDRQYNFTEKTIELVVNKIIVHSKSFEGIRKEKGGKKS